MSAAAATTLRAASARSGRWANQLRRQHVDGYRARLRQLRGRSGQAMAQFGFGQVGQLDQRLQKGVAGRRWLTADCATARAARTRGSGPAR